MTRHGAHQRLSAGPGRPVLHDYVAAGAAVATPEAAALFPSIFGLATGGVRIAFSDIEEL